MKKANLAEEPTSFAIEIECTGKPQTQGGEVEYTVTAPEAGISKTFEVPVGTSEETIVECAKNVIAHRLAAIWMGCWASGSACKKTAIAVPIGGLKVQLRLPTEDAVNQIIEQSAKTAK